MAYDCPVFYVNGAPYPDGACSEGRLYDADRGYCTEDDPPCPFCNNDEYQEWLLQGNTILYPYGFGQFDENAYYAPKDMIAYKKVIDYEEEDT